MAGSNAAPSTGAELEQLARELITGDFPNVAHVALNRRVTVGIARIACCTTGFSGEAWVGSYSLLGEQHLNVHVVGEEPFDELLPYVDCGSFGFVDDKSLWRPCSANALARVPRENPHAAAASGLLHAVQAGEGLAPDGPELHEALRELSGPQHAAPRPVLTALEWIDQ